MNDVPEDLVSFLKELTLLMAWESEKQGQQNQPELREVKMTTSPHKQGQPAIKWQMYELQMHLVPRTNLLSIEGHDCCFTYAFLIHTNKFSLVAWTNPEIQGKEFL